MPSCHSERSLRSEESLFFLCFVEEGFLASLGMTTKGIFQQPLRDLLRAQSCELLAPTLRRRVFAARRERKAASGRRSPASRQLTINSSEKDIRGGHEPPLFVFPTAGNINKPSKVPNHPCQTRRKS